MPCYHPITAYRSRQGRSLTGGWPLVFNRRDGFEDMPVEVPCGQCIGCRLERSRQWAVRCCLEAQMHKDNCFITLTYRPECLPEDHSLCKEHFTKFMKRLRKMMNVKNVKYLMCGEYGSKHDRPHFHACIFGIWFSDARVMRASTASAAYGRSAGHVTTTPRSGSSCLYRSDMLEKLWPYGFCTIGEVTFESAAYVARYCVKKVTGPSAEKYYDGRVPEYSTMSRRPGLAASWFDKYGKSDVLPHDEIIIRNGLRCRPPRYYDNMLSKVDRLLMDKIKYRRSQKLRKEDNTFDRLAVKEFIAKSGLKQLSRSLHDVNVEDFRRP